jgi:hypothetical protein
VSGKFRAGHHGVGERRRLSRPGQARPGTGQRAALAAPHGGPRVRLPRFPAARPAARAKAAVAGKQAATYLSPAGTDTGTCPTTHPCATITYAQSQTAAGGTIHLASGRYKQSADLTQPVHLQGASRTATIIDGTGIDYTTRGYYGLIGIANATGTAGAISVSDLTVTHPYITAAEANLDQGPVDIADYDQQAGDQVRVTDVNFGPAQDEADYPGIGYYSLSSQATVSVDSDQASGMYQAYFTEGSGGTAEFTGDTASKLAGDTYQGTFYPAAGLFALSDTSGSLRVTARSDDFTGYDGFGIAGEAGYSQGNCSTACSGGLTLTATGTVVSLTAAPADSGVAGIALLAGSGDALTATVTSTEGQVTGPDVPFSVVTDGGDANVTDTENTVLVSHYRHRAGLALGALAVQGPAGEYPGEVTPVVTVGVDVLARRGALGGQRGGLRRARPGGQRLLGGGGPQRHRAHVGQRDPAARRRDADDRPVVGPPGELLVAPRLAWRVRYPHRRQQLILRQRGLEVPGEEVVRADGPDAARTAQLHAAAEGDQRHRQVGGRVGVRERAADGAPVPDLRVADLGGGVRQQRCRLPHQRRGGQLGVPRGRSDDQLTVRAADPAQPVRPADVDQHRGRGQPQLHHRQQRVAAGQQLGVVAVLGQQADRFCGRAGRQVVERGGDHRAPSGSPSGLPGTGRSPAPAAAAASTALTML